MTRLAWYTTVVLLTLTLLFLAWQFRLALVFFLLAVAVSAAFRRGMNYLIDRGYSQLFSVAFVYGIFIVISLALVFLFYTPFIKELDHGTNELINGYSTIRDTWSVETNLFRRSVAAQMPPADELFREMIIDSPELASSVWGFVMDILEFGGKGAIVLVLSIYWNIEYIRIERFWLSLLPYEWRSRIRSLWKDVEDGISLYITSEALRSFMAFILLWLGYQLMGYRFPVLLAMSGALLRFVPWVGPLLALLLVVISGLNGNLWIIVLSSVYTLGVLYGLRVLAERYFRPAHRISLLLVVVVMIVLIQAVGGFGIVLATPLAAVIQILGSHLLGIYSEAKERSEESDMADLRERMEVVDEMISNQPEPAMPEVTNLVGRLRELIQRSSEQKPAEDRESRSV